MSTGLRRRVEKLEKAAPKPDPAAIDWDALMDGRAPPELLGRPKAWPDPVEERIAALVVRPLTEGGSTDADHD